MKEAAGDITGCRVFVVEDDGMLSMLLEDLLAAMGGEVVGIAARLDEALEQCTRLEFDVAMLDVNLRGERSFPVAEALQAAGKPFVLVTGYGSTILPPALRSAPLLQKPYRRQELGAALWDALHGA